MTVVTPPSIPVPGAAAAAAGAAVQVAPVEPAIPAAALNPDRPPKHPEPPEDPPCTTTSHASGNFFDLSPLTRAYPADTADWTVRGHDHPANFTLNFCAPLLLPLPNHPTAANVSAVAKYPDGSIVPIGSLSTAPKFRGRSLVLEYTGGSPCLTADGADTGLTTSTLISFKCAHEMKGPGAVSFVGSLDNCTYFFEARTIHACPAVNQRQTIAPVSMFAVILFVAVGVWLVGSMILHPSMSWARVKANLKPPFLFSRIRRPTDYSTHEYYKRSGGANGAANGLYRDDKDPISIVIPSAANDERLV